jgi:hypothetical protein
MREVLRALVALVVGRAAHRFFPTTGLAPAICTHRSATQVARAAQLLAEQGRYTLGEVLQEHLPAPPPPWREPSSSASDGPPAAASDDHSSADPESDAGPDSESWSDRDSWASPPMAGPAVPCPGPHCNSSVQEAGSP